MHNKMHNEIWKANFPKLYQLLLKYYHHSFHCFSEWKQLLFCINLIHTLCTLEVELIRLHNVHKTSQSKCSDKDKGLNIVIALLIQSYESDSRLTVLYSITCQVAANRRKQWHCIALFTVQAKEKLDPWYSQVANASILTKPPATTHFQFR